MKYFSSFLILCCYTSALFGQQVNICLEKVGSDLQVKLYAAASFQGVVSNIQFAIKCDDPNVTYSTVSQNPSEAAYIPLTKANAESVLGGNKYQKFTGFGKVNMNTSGVTWTAGQSVLLMTITPSSISPNFAIVNDAWTNAENGDFYAELNGVPKTGIIGADCTIASAFAIDLGPLSAYWTENGAKLEWLSYNELDVAYFDIERMDENRQFVSIDQVGAIGNSHTTRQYNYVDKDILPTHTDLIYYRIKALSLDGGIKYTNIVELRSEDYTNIQYYPNPTNAAFQLLINTRKEKTIGVKIWDATGKNMYQLTENTANFKQEIATDDWASGIYFMEVYINGNLQTMKIVKE
jgi:Secretion system C-terminal sorting domain